MRPGGPARIGRSCSTTAVVPTTIWQGGLDDVHTPAMARWLHAAIPGPRLVLRDDDATFDFFDELREILAELTVATT